MIGYVLRHSNIGIKCTSTSTEVSYPSFFKNENAMKNACCLSQTKVFACPRGNVITTTNYS